MHYSKHCTILVIFYTITAVLWPSVSFSMGDSTVNKLQLHWVMLAFGPPCLYILIMYVLCIFYNLHKVLQITGCSIMAGLL